MHGSKNFFAVSTWLLIAFGCAQPGGGSIHPSLSDKKSYEAKPQCLHIVNGASTTKWASIGLLLILKDKNAIMGMCTGTFVGHNTMVTAAHCITKGSEKQIVFVRDNNPTFKYVDEVESLVGKGVRPLKVIHNAPDLLNAGGPTVSVIREYYRDIAILIFPDNTAPKITRILERAPEDGENAELVGFGDSEIDHGTKASSAKKRYGRNSILYDQDKLGEDSVDMIFLTGRASTETSGNSDDALAAHGDSGGPLLIDNKLAGVAGGGGMTEDLDNGVDLNAEAFNVYGYIGSSFAKKVLRKAEDAGADIQYESDLGSDTGDDESISGDEDDC